MATAFTRERDAKKEAKRAKAAAEKEEKNRQQQAKIVEEFNEKQANANGASDPVGKLKAWCSKPPYLDLTNDVKVSVYLLLANLCLTNLVSFCRETPTFKSSLTSRSSRRK